METKMLGKRMAMNKRTVADLNGDGIFRYLADRRVAALSESPMCLTREGPICMSESPFCQTD